MVRYMYTYQKSMYGPPGLCGVLDRKICRRSRGSENTNKSPPTPTRIPAIVPTIAPMLIECEFFCESGGSAVSFDLPLAVSSGCDAEPESEEVWLRQEESDPVWTKKGKDCAEMRPLWEESVARRVYSPSGTFACGHDTTHVRASTEVVSVRSTSGSCLGAPVCVDTARSFVTMIANCIGVGQSNSHVNIAGWHVDTFAGGENWNAPEGMAEAAADVADARLPLAWSPVTDVKVEVSSTVEVLATT